MPSFDHLKPDLAPPQRKGFCAQAVRGVTLIELLIVMAIIGVLLSLGVPSYRSFSNNSRISGAINALLGDLQFTRAEANKRGSFVSACASVSGSTCSASTSWDTGWIVFVDNNNNGTVDADEAILRKKAAFSNTDSAVADSDVARITFNREAFISNLTVDPVTITFKPLNAIDPTWTRCLAVGQMGRMTVQKSGTGVCL
jgi:type IV fimbrial biogenesis protein FimT